MNGESSFRIGSIVPEYSDTSKNNQAPILEYRVGCLPFSLPKSWISKKRKVRVTPKTDYHNFPRVSLTFFELFWRKSQKNTAVKIEPLPGITNLPKNSPQNEGGLVFYDAVVDPQNIMAIIKRGDINGFRSMMLSHKVDINTIGMWSNTPLLVACQYGKEDIASEILRHHDVDVNHKNDKGATALLFACLEGFEPVVRALLGKGAEVDVTPAIVYNSHTDLTNPCTPFSVSITNGHLSCLKLLASEKEGTELMNTRLPLSFAKGNLVISSRDLGISPIQLACSSGHPHIVEFLLQSGCDTTLRDHSNKNILHELCRLKLNSFETLTVLHQYNRISEDLLLSSDLQGESAFHVACDSKNIKVVEKLLEIAAQSNLISKLLQAKDKNGATALHVSVKRRCEPVVKLLVMRGASVSAPDNNGVTPLDMAAKFGKDNKILSLLRVGDEKGSLPTTDVSSQSHGIFGQTDESLETRKGDSTGDRDEGVNDWNIELTI